MTGTSLKKFTKQVSVNSSGELTVNAGRYSRAAIIMAFEMLGGVEGFATWADENKDDYYTKLFGKLIGREVEPTQADDVEDLLDILDGDCEDITDAEIVEAGAEENDDTDDIFEPTAMELRMVRAAAECAAAEPLD